MRYNEQHFETKSTSKFILDSLAKKKAAFAAIQATPWPVPEYRNVILDNDTDTNILQDLVEEGLLGGLNEALEPESITIGGVVIPPSAHILAPVLNWHYECCHHWQRIIESLAPERAKDFICEVYDLEIEDGMILLGDCRLDLDNGVLHAALDHRVVKLYTLDGEFTSPTTMMLMFAILAHNMGVNEVNALIPELSSLWVSEMNYGMPLTEQDTLWYVRHYTLGMVQSTVAYEWPGFGLRNSTDIASPMEKLLNSGTPVMPDKYGVNRLVWGPGAEALGVYMQEGNIVMLHDGKKDPKVLNRPWNGLGATTADAYPGETLEASPLRFHVQAGVEPVQALVRGQRHRVMVTDLRTMNHGSGVAVVPRGWTCRYGVLKTLPGILNEAMLQDGMSLEGAQAELANLTIEILGKSFKPGATILTYQGYPLVVNENEAPVLVSNIEVRRLTTSCSLAIRVTATLYSEDTEVKFRVPGGKFTTLAQDVLVDGHRNTKDLIVTIEGRKGGYLEILIAVNALGGGYQRGSFIHLDDGRVADLRDPNNCVTQWIRNNIVQRVFTHRMSRAFFDTYEEGILGDDVKVIQVLDDYVVLQETASTLSGEVVLGVEVSTPIETIGKSNMTLQQVAVTWMTDPRLGADLWERGRKSRAAVFGFIMGPNKTARYDAHTSKPLELVIVDKKTGKPVLDEKGDKQPLVDAAGKPIHLVGQELLDYWILRLQGNALVVATRNQSEIETVIDLESIRALGSFESSGMGATGVALGVVELLMMLANRPSGYDSKVHALNASVRGAIRMWQRDMRGSRSVLKRLGSLSSVLDSGKIKTSTGPEVQPVDGVPVVLMHGQCPLIDQLDADEGDILLLYRAPMVGAIACRVIFSLEDAAIGHLRVAADVWQAGNAGDSDGDPVAALNLTKWEERRERASV